ncbi:MAG: GNAT family N-acetyltransferase, partial [Polaromonas sp.]
LRNTIKRRTKKFAADGGTLELVVDGVGLERGLDAFERVYRVKWKKGEPYSKFIPGLVRTCAERGWLRLATAWFNGEPIAAQLWIVANGKANIYKVAYNEAFKLYAPGTLVTAMLMEHVIEQDKVTEVDFLIGDDAYKKKWMSHRRERWGIIAYDPKTLQGLLGLGQEILGRMMMPLVVRTKPAACTAESQ